MQAHAQPGADEDLVPDPFARFGVGFEGRQQPVADAGDDGAEDHEGRVIPQSGDEAACDDGENHGGQKHGQVHDAGFDGRGALDGLEPDGEVVDGAHEGGAQAEGEDGGGPDGAFLDDAGRDSAVVLHLELDEDEGDDQDAEEHK